jgi:FMN phosphatase YigB (HAD superfamily)
MIDSSLAYIPPEKRLYNFFSMIRRNEVIDSQKRSLVVPLLENYVSSHGDVYVYDDVRSFLVDVKNEGWEIAILTHGDMDFQLCKIQGTFLLQYFDSLIITSEDKWKRDEIFNSPQTIFIDDHPKNIDLATKKFPHIVSVEIKRKDAKYEHYLSKYAHKRITSLLGPLYLP